MNDWHTRFQRSQQLATAFSRLGYRCIYLNPHLGRQFEKVRYGAPEHRIGVLGENLYELHVRLPREPVFHHRLLTASECAIVQDAIAAALDTLRISRAVQVVSFPLWFESARAVRRLKGHPLVYDCHDLLSGFGNIAPELIGAEERHMPDADLVLFSSERLQEHFTARDGRCAGRSLLLRNAADFDHFEGVSRKTSRPPSAVYAGALDHWFDADALRAAAHANPECPVSLIGRIEWRRLAELALVPNVRMLGEVEYHRLPSLLCESDVGLIPFRVNALTLATNPIKLYEYFSLGMPVVSTAIPEVEQFGDLVYIASSNSGFASALQRALREDDPERRQRRKALARAESWEKRASVLSAEFQRLAGTQTSLLAGQLQRRSGIGA